MLKDLSLESQQCGGSDAKKAKLWKRIKMSFKSSEGKALLVELEECNSMLERLSRAAIQAKAIREDTASSSSAWYFQAA